MTQRTCGKILLAGAIGVVAAIGEGCKDHNKSTASVPCAKCDELELRIGRLERATERSVLRWQHINQALAQDHLNDLLQQSRRLQDKVESILEADPLRYQHKSLEDLEEAIGEQLEPFVALYAMNLQSSYEQRGISLSIEADCYAQARAVARSAARGWIAAQAGPQ